MAETLTAHLYVDDASYQRERVSVFGREWMVLGRTTEIVDAGGYIAEEIAGYPVFVVVDADGIPWAYHNVCPHRAGPILLPGRGQTDELVCQYHGWCFSYEGALVDAPGFGENKETSIDDQRLREVSMGHWGGMLWVSLGGNMPPLQEALGQMVGECDDIDFGNLHHTAHNTSVFDCNWKVFVDNYLESYHVPGTHKILESHFDLDQSFVTIHDDAYTLQQSQTREGVPIRWFFRYPNVGLQVLGDTLCWMQVLPQGPEKTLVVLDHYAPDGVDDTPLKSLCARLLEEDRVLCELVQRNLAAGIYQRGPLSPTHESAVAWFHSKVLTAQDLRAE